MPPKDENQRLNTAKEWLSAAACRQNVCWIIFRWIKVRLQTSAGNVFRRCLSCRSFVAHGPSRKRNVSVIVFTGTSLLSCLQNRQSANNDFWHSLVISPVAGMMSLPESWCWWWVNDRVEIDVVELISEMLMSASMIVLTISYFVFWMISASIIFVSYVSSMSTDEGSSSYYFVG